MAVPFLVQSKAFKAKDNKDNTKYPEILADAIFVHKIRVK